jgi:hypothetical protein
LYFVRKSCQGFPGLSASTYCRNESEKKQQSYSEESDRKVHRMAMHLLALFNRKMESKIA